MRVQGWTTKFQEVVRNVVLVRLLGLAADGGVSPVVRSVATSEVEKLKAELTRSAYARQLVEIFERDPKQLQLPPPVEAPPGQPIGEGLDDSLF